MLFSYKHSVFIFPYLTSLNSSLDLFLFVFLFHFFYDLLLFKSLEYFPTSLVISTITTGYSLCPFLVTPASRYSRLINKAVTFVFVFSKDSVYSLCFWVCGKNAFRGGVCSVSQWVVSLTCPFSGEVGMGSTQGCWMHYFCHFPPTAEPLSASVFSFASWEYC